MTIAAFTGLDLLFMVAVVVGCWLAWRLFDKTGPAEAAGRVDGPDAAPPLDGGRLTEVGGASVYDWQADDAA